jgi:hypothetical protein
MEDPGSLVEPRVIGLSERVCGELGGVCLTNEELSVLIFPRGPRSGAGGEKRGTVEGSEQQTMDGGTQTKGQSPHVKRVSASAHSVTAPSNPRLGRSRLGL